MADPNERIVYSHQLDSSGGQPRLLHMHDSCNRCILDTLVSAEVVITDGRGSFYYITSDLLNLDVHNSFKKAGTRFPRISLVQRIVGERRHCVPVGSFREQLGPSANNNFVLVRIGRDQLSRELLSSAVTINDLLGNLRKPQGLDSHTYTVQSRGSKLASYPLAGTPRRRPHYIKEGSSAQLMALQFAGRPGSPGEMLELGDAGLWVHIQDDSEAGSKASLPRPGQKGCKLVGHVACIDDKDIQNTKGEVLVHPLEQTIEGLAQCLGWVKDSRASYYVKKPGPG
ncbi:hypothetical protein DL769_003028 [Monosporascus sp. CRB-8-3]|nr:hypothetical protein DL769_003028 [Monosporascus sp. CRB-8-3]